MPVEIDSGLIEGSVESGVHVFRSIPYGDPTGGTSRFLPPQPVTPWPGIRSTTQFAGVAPQTGPLASRRDVFGLRPITEDQSEDCLRLSIWTPDLAGSLPVLVWIHGGGHSTGAGSSPVFNGTALAGHEDVVVVTVNHRLGILGHLQLPRSGKEVTSGNSATLDLIACLQWVQRNISSFGGDPTRVTLFGESSGAIKIGALMATPLASGLFHRAILQSGAPSALLTQDETDQASHHVAERLGVTRLNHDYLSQVPLEVLLGIQREMESIGTPGNRFGPAYDDVMLFRDNDEAFFPQVVNSVPIIIGSNLDEARYFILSSRAFRDPDYIVTETDLHTRLERLVGKHADGLIATYHSFYPDENNRDLLFRLASAQMRCRTNGYAEHLLHTSSSRVHMYLFDWRSTIYQGQIRSCHAMEIPFVFENVAKSRAAQEGTSQALVSSEMSALWRSFAQYSIPRTSSLGVWDPYVQGERATLRIGEETHLAYDPLDLEREAWSSIAPYEGRSNWTAFL